MSETLFAMRAAQRLPILGRAPWTGVGPHDLLRLRRHDVLHFDEPPPPWVLLALREVPWVVVRRAVAREDLLPVGVRGDARHLRYAGWVAPEDVERALSPHALRDHAVCLSAKRAALPAARALAAVERAWVGWSLPWGPGGSLGFELATGWPTVAQASDLDLVIHARHALSHDEARSQMAKLPLDCGVRIDVQLETPAGAVALSEFAAQDAGCVMLRGAQGARLVRDPWSFEATRRTC